VCILQLRKPLLIGVSCPWWHAPGSRSGVTCQDLLLVQVVFPEHEQDILDVVH